MPHGHSHGNSDAEGHNEKASVWTILTTLMNGIIDVSGSYYTLSELIALLDGSEDSNSTPARVVGSLAAVAALSSFYVHFYLYKYHQAQSKKESKNPPADAKLPQNSSGKQEIEIIEIPEEEEVENHGPDVLPDPIPAKHSLLLEPSSLPSSSSFLEPSIQKEEKKNLSEPLPDSVAITIDQSPKPVPHSHTHHKHEHKPGRLTCGQTGALALDAFTHTIGSGGALAALVNGLVKGRLGLWGKAAIHAGSLAGGALAAVGEVQNCRDVLVKKNEKEAEATCGEGHSHEHSSLSGGQK